MTIHDDHSTDISATRASGGVKLKSVRYVLLISMALAVMAGVIIWNIFAQ